MWFELGSVLWAALALACAFLAAQRLFPSAAPSRGGGGDDGEDEDDLSWLLYSDCNRFEQPHEGFFEEALPGRDARPFDESEKGAWVSRAPPLRKGARPAVLRTYSVVPSSSPVRAAVLFLPEFRSHCGVSVHLFRRLARYGVACHGFDPEGHGESEAAAGADRGEVPAWRRLAFEAVAFGAGFVRARHPGCAGFFVAGEGVGATAALAVALLRPDEWTGLAMAGPALELPRLEALEGRCKLACRLWAGRWRVGGVYAHNGEHSRNLAVEERADRDPLHGGAGPTSARTALELLGLVRWVAAHAASLSVPYLLQHGARDLVVPASASRALFFATRRLSPLRAEVMLYHHCWHLLLQEPEGDEMAQRVADWVVEQAARHDAERSLD